MARFFHCGLTQQELMKRAFRIKPLAPSIRRDIQLPDDLRAQFVKMHFTMPTDLELGTLDDGALIMEKDPADMLTPVRTIPVTLNARGNSGFYPIISELLSAVPEDLLYTVTAFSAEPDKKQPHDADGHQRALVTFYEGELPQKIQDQYIIYDGQAYSPDWRLMEKLDRITVMKPVRLKAPGM